MKNLKINIFDTEQTVENISKSSSYIIQRMQNPGKVKQGFLNHRQKASNNIYSRAFGDVRLGIEMMYK